MRWPGTRNTSAREALPCDGSPYCNAEREVTTLKDLKHLIYFESLLDNADNELVEQARKDGKYVGTMVEIDPRSKYARQMVEVQ